jgi:ribosome-associated protein
MPAEGPPPGEALRVNASLALPLSEIRLRASRSSGPGGQHANVTASRIEASFDVGESATLDELERELLLSRIGPRVVVVAQESRSQRRNRELALERLARRIADALEVQPERRATRPTAASRERRLMDKRRRAERKAARRPPAEP